MAKLASTRVYGNLVVDNALNIAGQLTSAVATGTAPFAVSSTTKVANLNADLLDGLHSDSAATVSTIAARTSNGYIYAVYFNSSNSAEATTASSYFYETGSDGFLRKKTLANVKTELVTSAAVIAGLGFTPYNATNPNNYISGINSSMVTSALGFTPYDSSNPNNYTSNSGTVTSVTAGTQVSGLTMTITNGSTTPSIATSISNAANFRSAIGAGTGNGTVTSVTGTTNHISVATGTTTPVISLATAFGDTINPYGAKAANLVLAGPASGGAAVPTFRTLVPADIPTLNQDTTGSALKLNVTDVRTIEDLDSYYELLPVQVTDKSVTSHFGYLSNAGADWRSILTVKGWSGDYGAWQLIGTANTTADDDLYFRSGAGTTWGTPVKIWHGGNLTNLNQLTNGPGYITSSSSITGTSAGVVKTVTGTTTAELVRGNMADNDHFRILVGGTASNAGYVEIATADDGTEPIYVRQYTGIFSTLQRTATLLDSSGNTSFPGTVSVNALTTGSSGQTWVIDGSGTSLLLQSGATPTTRLTLTNAGALTVTGAIVASNFSGSSSGTNTGDQTNISGTAANVTGIVDVANGGTGNTSVDTTPTASSTKMVTSGGVYTALGSYTPTSRTINGLALSSNITLGGAEISPVATFSASGGETTTNLSASHANKFWTVGSNGVNRTLYLSKAVSDTLAIGTEIHLMHNASTYTITISVEGTLTLQSLGSKVKLAGLYAVVTLKKIAATTWLLFGALA